MNIDQELNSIAVFLKSNTGIVFSYEVRLDSDIITLIMSLRQHRLARKISRCALIADKCSLMNVILEMKTQLENTASQTASGGGKTNPFVTVINHPITQEHNMTNDTHKIFTDFELAQIATMKNMATSVMMNTFYLKDAFLAGGCFTSFAYSDTPKDYDVFITDGGAKEVMKAHATPDNFVINQDPSYWQNPMIEATLLDKRTSVQYILTKFKSRREVVDHFDMLHCCVSYVLSEDKLYISKKVIETINARKIIPNGDKKIAHWRRDKMLRKGWSE